MDVWCEAPMTSQWLEVATSLAELRTEERDLAYYFVFDFNPHNAVHYDKITEGRIAEAHRHELCVGWGAIGLVRLRCTRRQKGELVINIQSTLGLPLRPQPSGNAAAGPPVATPALSCVRTRKSHDPHEGGRRRHLFR